MLHKIESYLRHVAEDLRWVINSPYLTNIQPEPELKSHPATTKLLDQINNDPKIITPYLTKMKRHNLGSYFETLVIFWLKHIPNLNIIAQNLQLQDDKQTVGELDLVFEYLGKFYHWELSVKFYANTFQKNSEASWVGPLKKDTLQRKFNRLFEHQLPLITRAREVLDIPTQTKINSYPFVKGVLFHHVNSFGDDQALPQRVNPLCLQKKWLEVKNIENYFTSLPSHFAVLSKLQWFSETVYEDWHILRSQHQILEILKQTNRPQLIAFANFSKNAPQPEEVLDRYFIMPDDWLHSPVIGAT